MAFWSPAMWSIVIGQTFLYIEPQCKDLDQLLSNKTATGRHPLNPAHCGAVVAEESYPLFGKGTTDMLHH